MEKLSFGAPLGTVMQIAFVVDDMERELAYWTRTLKIGPFFRVKHFPLREATYRGARISPDLDVALAFSGTSCFELVQQNDHSPSPYRGRVTNPGIGFHHWGVPTRTFEADLAAREREGMTLVASASVAIGGRCAYFESASASGPLLELIEMTPPVEQFFGMIQAAAEGWNGSDPVRLVG